METPLIPKSSPLPPKKGLSKIQQAMNKPVLANDNCPAGQLCQKLGTFRPGACFLGTADTHKCMVSTILLLGKFAEK